MVYQPLGNSGLGIFWYGRMLTLNPSFKVKRGQPKLKVLINSLIIGPRGLGL